MADGRDKPIIYRVDLRNKRRVIYTQPFQSLTENAFTPTQKNLLSAARVYQGQTTNFRTPGGGFRPVFQL